MNKDVFDSEMWENAHGFLSVHLIKQINRLAVSSHLDVDERRDILSLSSAIAELPNIDPNYSCNIEIDFSWDDLNWIGRLEFFQGEFSIWSCMHQLDGIKSELCGQWQHTALKFSSKEWVESSELKHDPAHLWLWIRCFRRFIDRFYGWGDSEAHGVMEFNSFFSDFILHAPPIENTKS